MTTLLERVTLIIGGTLIAAGLTLYDLRIALLVTGVLLIAAALTLGDDGT